MQEGKRIEREAEKNELFFDKISMDWSPAPLSLNHQQFFHQLHMPRQLYICLSVFWLPEQSSRLQAGVVVTEARLFWLLLLAFWLVKEKK